MKQIISFATVAGCATLACGGSSWTLTEQDMATYIASLSNHTLEDFEGEQPEPVGTIYDYNGFDLDYESFYGVEDDDNIEFDLYTEIGFPNAHATLTFEHAVTSFGFALENFSGGEGFYFSVNGEMELLYELGLPAPTFVVISSDTPFTSVDFLQGGGVSTIIYIDDVVIPAIPAPGVAAPLAMAGFVALRRRR